MHLAVIGTGRVGSAVAYTLLRERLFDEISLVDIKSKLVKGVAEELKHVAAAFNIDTEIHAFDRDEDVSGADVVIVCAGYPRIPGVKMDKRELAQENAEIIRYIAEVVPPRNRGAKYVIVTNPVDAMATLFKKVSREKFVISTGTHIESIRLRAKIASQLKVSVSSVEGFVGGEHGKAAVILWSTIKVHGENFEEYVRKKGILIDKREITKYVKVISKVIIDYVGGTSVGPASAFREIIRSIVLNERKLISIAIPLKINDIPEKIHISIPSIVGREIYPKIEMLTDNEIRRIFQAAKEVYSVYSKVKRRDKEDCS